MPTLLPRPLARALAALLLLAAAVLGAAALPAPTAGAHSVLVGTDPADGATLPRVPDAVTLTFNEDVKGQFSKVIVTGPDQQPVTTQVTATGPTVRAALPTGLPAGGYHVVYSVVSADTHRINGELRFTVAGPGTSSSAAPTAAPSSALASASAPAATPTTAAARPSSGSSWTWLGPLLSVLLAVPMVWVARRENARRKRAAERRRVERLRRQDPL